MTRLTAARDFLLESLRLLYWAFFKPFTLREHLRDIDPDLDIYTNPFKFRDRFPTNPRLRRYAEQVWWLIALTPLLLVPLAGWLYPALSGETFDWLRAFLFLAGWWLGLALARRSISTKIAWIFIFTVMTLLQKGLERRKSVGYFIASLFGNW